MIAIWESDKGDKEIHKDLKTRSKNNRGYILAAKSILNTDEAYEVESETGLRNLISDITEYATATEAVSKKDRTDYPDVVALVDNLINLYRQGKAKYILDLCTRFGKTGTFCRLAKELNKLDTRIHILASYVGTVKTSYSEDINTLKNNENCLFVDPDAAEDTATLVKTMKDWLKNEDHYICYYVALTGDEDTCFARRVEALDKFKSINKSIVIEEADYGAGRDKQIKKIKHLYDTKSNNFKLIIATTGTQAEKCENIIEPDVVIKRDYILDVLNKRSNAVGISWYCLNNSEMVKVFGYTAAEMENFSDMFTVDNNKLRGELWLRDTINFLFNKQLPVINKETRKYRHYKLLNDAATMVFTPSTKEGQKVFVELLEQLLPGHKVVLVNGDETTNAEAEALVKQTIKDCGTNVVVVASGMANRSFSIPEIKNVILMCNTGDPTQKIARGLTPWSTHTEMKCNVIDFRLSYATSNLSNYLTKIALDSLDETSTHTTIQQILEEIQASDKLAFYEYFSAGADPIRQLEMTEIKQQMHSRDYQVARALRVLTVDIDEIDLPDERFTISEKLNFNDLASSNIKGDADRKTYINRTVKAAVGESKKELKEDQRINYIALLLNRRYIFDSGKYETNVLKNEFRNNMPDSRKQAVENTLGIDMKVMCQIVDLLIRNEIAIYG
jgi:hypothetical protein